MSLHQTIGHYRITAKLGQGGMGEVWRATDNKLGREVAIKILPEAFARDPERLARFEREAKVLASLNHPHIAQIYGVEDRALIMELAEGESPKGPMPFEEAWKIAQQIAEALEYAHEKGVIHRDLKPANVTVTPDGKVKLLDFGLAKAFGDAPDLIGSDPENSPTMTFGATAVGAILGTAAYMAPEQAKGKQVDKRCDIWAWGVVLYELLAGERLFAGETAADTMAQVLTREPDLKRVPAQARRLLRRCLEKDQKRRLRDMGDAADLLEDRSPEVAAQQGTVSKFAPWVITMLALALATFAFWVPRRTGPSIPEDVIRLSLETAPAKMLGPELFCCRPSYKSVALSPDGRTVVFSAVSDSSTRQAQLYKRTLDQSNAIPVAGTTGAEQPFFSPDGQWVGFWAEGKLKKIPVAGGPAVAICEVPGGRISGLSGASWSSTDDIAYVAGGDLMQVPASGGTPKVIMDSGQPNVYSTPEFLPDGKTLLLTLRTSDWESAQVVARRLDTGDQRVLLKGGADARYLPTGHLIYLQSGVLMAVPFDARRVQLTGPPVAMVDGVMQSINMPNFTLETGMGQFAISASGSLVYASGGVAPLPMTTLVRVDRKGVETELDAPKGNYAGPRLSPDGSRVAVHVVNSISATDIWVIEAKAGTATRLTSQGTNAWPLWSPDGKRILFASGAGYTQILSVPADGSGTAEVVMSGRSGLRPASWPSELLPLVYLARPQDQWEIWSRLMSGAEKPKRFLESGFDLTDAGLSPDGRWVAYRSGESGANEIYVQAFPAGEKHRISTAGGINLAWARNGRELFYLEPRSSGKYAMMAVDFVAQGAFQAGRPHALFEKPLMSTVLLRSYDITPDGQHFIMPRRENTPEEHVSKVNVVLHWSEEVKKRATGGPR